MGEARRRILFSGGGTVGHLAPGFALAAALEARGIECLFATPGESVEATWFRGRTPPHTLPAVRLPRGLGALLRFPGRFRSGVQAARALLAAESIGAVVALGGWPCAPAAWACRGAATPLAFLVPDAVPGLVVRKLAGRAGRLYLADARAAAQLADHPGLRQLGPLLRSEALATRRDPAAVGLRADRRAVLVTGGSLGAQRLDERFLDGLEAAVAQTPELVDRIQVLHAVGAHASDASSRYERLGISHAVLPFIHDMGAAYGTADLVLCRAGASTCAELAATRTPAVLIPYPHHADRQQFRNAAPLVEAGAARLLEQAALTPEAVGREILGLLEDDAALAALRAAPNPAENDAAGEAATDFLRFLEWAT